MTHREKRNQYFKKTDSFFPDLKSNRYCLWHCILWLAKEIETSAVFSVLLFLMQGLTLRDEVADKALSKTALQMV